MTDLNPDEVMVVTYIPPALTCGEEDELGVSVETSCGESSVVKQRWELPQYLIGCIKAFNPNRVVFKTIGSDIENALSDSTLRAIKSGALSAEDLGIYMRR